MRAIFEEIWERALPYLQTRENELHTRVALGFAEKLLVKEGGDDDVVIPAVMLHDVGWTMVPEDLQYKAFGPGASLPEVNRIHEVEGARIAGAILDDLGYDTYKIDEILEIIDGHDSRPVGLSLNDRLVKDADRLWRCTPENFRFVQKWFNMTPLQSLERLTARLDEWFLTPTGRSLAEQELAARRLSLEG